MGDKCIGWDGSGGGGSSGTAGGDLSGTYPDPNVAAIHETSGPTKLTIGAIADGQFAKRVGATLVGATPSTAPTGAAGGDLGGTYPNPTAVGFHDGASTALTYGTILDGQAMQRNGTSIDGVFARATWSTSGVRYFAVDFTSGNDANVGFSDVNMATAGTVAKKTIAGMLAIFPALGQGRTAVIAIKPRDASGTSYGEKIFISTLGYQRIIIRGTTDFSNTTSDQITAGARQAAVGPNGDGSWTVTTGATVQTVTIAAGTFSASPALRGKRARFTGNVTAGLANICATIQTHTTTALAWDRDTALTPANGDTFFVEDQGVLLDQIELASVALAGSQSITVVGIAVANTTADAIRVRGAYALVQFAFCEQRGTAGATVLTRVETNALVFCSFNYLNESEVSRVVGGARIEGTAVFRFCGQLFVTGWQFTGSTSVSVQLLDIQNLTRFGEGGSVRAVGASAIQLIRCAPVAQSGTTALNQIGNQSQATVRRLVIDNGGGILINESNVNVKGVDISGAGAVALVTVRGLGCQVGFDDLVGSTGNTGVGIDATLAMRAILTFGLVTAVTATGTAGDIKMPGNGIAAYAGLATTNVVDEKGNDYIGTSGVVVREATQFTNTDGSALAVGELVRVSATNNVVRAQADTQAHATGPLWVAITPPANNTAGLFVSAAAAQKWVLFNAAPTLSALGYLFNTTAGLASTTVPAAGTNQKRRLGYVSKVSGSFGLVNGTCENIPTDADGAL